MADHQSELIKTKKRKKKQTDYDYRSDDLYITS